MREMPEPPIPESPSARVLLELAASSADAGLSVGGRAVLLRGGAIVDIAAAPGDLSFGEFLLAAGRISEAELEVVQQRAEERAQGLDEALRELEAVSEEVLFTTRRALLLDRLVRAFAAEEAEGQGAAEPVALSQLVLDAAYATPELVFDALTRRASFGDAELIGALPAARFVWAEGAEPRRAAEWADLGDIPIAVSLGTLFPRHPAAPSRIAALLRAGVAKLDVTDGILEAAVQRRSTRPGPAAAAGDDPSNALGPLAIAPVPSWFTISDQPLADPLASTETQALELDRAEAAPHTRAAAWLALAEGWRAQHSLGEAARAAREAAAAAPHDVTALAAATRLAASAGDPEAALAYGHAWVQATEPGAAQAEALSELADLAQRAGKPEQVRPSRQRAAEALPGDAKLEEQLARALAAEGEVQLAVEHARKAADLLRGPAPERACALLAWATELAPANPRTWNDLARVIARTGKSALAVATLAHASRIQSDGALRERLRASALAFAESTSRPDLAAEVLLEAGDASAAGVDRLLSNLYGAGDWATLSVFASELAAKSPPAERAGLLIFASEASIALQQNARALERLSDAVVSDPEHAEAYDRLFALAQELGELRAVWDALERAIRVRCPDRAAAAALSPETRGEVVALLERFLQLLTGPEAAPCARYVAELWYAIDGRTLELEDARMQERELAVFEAQLQKREHALRAAPPHARNEHALRLAALCRLDPERRATARKLYAKVLEREPDHPVALAELASLLRLDGDLLGLRMLFEAHSAATPLPDPLLALAFLELDQRDLARALDACWRAITPHSSDPEALTLALSLARATGDHTRAASALRALGDVYEAPAARARMRMRLARYHAQRGEHEESAAAARDALAIDPDCAEAALAVRLESEDLPLRERVAALASARHALGDDVALLHKLARAAYAAADAATQRAAFEALLPICPYDSVPARALVAMHSTGNDAQRLAGALELALGADRFTEDALYVVGRGLVRLVALGEPRRAAELVVTALPLLGERARPLLVNAESAARAAEAPELVTAVLEQRVALAAPDEQPARLRELAAHHHEQGTRWAEARALLRLLALVPDDREALVGLARSYAFTREVELLRAVLESLHDSARNEEEARERLFELALAALYLEHDPERGASLVARAVAPKREGRELYEVSVETLRRGVGLLRAADPERAFKLLLELAGDASIVRSRELLEEALMLAEHELGDPVRALDAAVQGTLAHPEHAPLVMALGRLAQALARIETWVDALEAGAEHTANPERQAEFLVLAAELAEHELSDAARASVLLDRAYRATPTDAIEALAVAAAGRLVERDLRAGKLAFDRLRDTLHVRAKFGAPIARARALLTLSRLAVDVYLAHEDAARYLDAARTALAASEDAAPDERARTLEDIEQRAAALAQPEGKPTRASAPRRSVSETEAPLLRALHGAPTFRPDASSTPPLHTARPAARSLIPTLEPTPPLSALAPIEIRAHAVTAIPSGSAQAEVSALATPVVAAEGLDTLVDDVAAGRVEALAELAERAQADARAARALSGELLARVRDGALHVCALRGLRSASAAANEHALWRTCSQALAFLEPTLRPPSNARRRDVHGASFDAALRAARASEQAPPHALFATLVEAAAPLFRKNHPAFPRGKEPEPLSEAPYGPLLHELGQLFAVEHAAYLVPSGEDRVGLFSVQPVCIAIGDRTPRDSASLRFRLARAFECARPEHVLLATLGVAELEALFAALFAAFSPADSARAQVSREVAGLAADLWRTMPSAAQRKLPSLLAELHEPLTPARWVEDLRVTSARAALCATRELEVALHQLGRDGDPSTVLSERSESAFDLALEGERLVRELVAYALSEPYLRALRDPDS